MSAEAVPAAEARAPRSERGEGRRGPRPEREPRPAPVADEAMPPVQAFVDTLPAAPADANAVSGEAGERDATRRRRRRGGRGRGRDEGGAEGAMDGSGEESPGSEQAVESAPIAVEATPTEAPRATEVIANEPRALRAEMQTPPPVATPAPLAAPIAAPASVVAPALAAPYHLPTETLAAIANDAGLQWVGSDADKIRAVQEAMANEPKPIHAPRAPKACAAVDDGPLVLIETKKDLSQVRLPFDA